MKNKNNGCVMNWAALRTIVVTLDLPFHVSIMSCFLLAMPWVDISQPQSFHFECHAR